MFRPNLIKELYQKETVKNEIPDKIGISKTNLFNIMNGNINPTVGNIEKIASFFGKTVGYFFDEPDFSEAKFANNILEREIIHLKREIEFKNKLIMQQEKTISAQDRYIETLTEKKDRDDAA